MLCVFSFSMLNCLHDELFCRVMFSPPTAFCRHLLNYYNYWGWRSVLILTNSEYWLLRESSLAFETLHTLWIMEFLWRILINAIQLWMFPIFWPVIQLEFPCSIELFQWPPIINFVSQGFTELCVFDYNFIIKRQYGRQSGLEPLTINSTSWPFWLYAY